MKDKNIIPKDRVQSMIETLNNMKVEVCDVAEKFMGHRDGEECPNEGCPLHDLCNALVSVWCKLTTMESMPLDAREEQG